MNLWFNDFHFLKLLKNTFKHFRFTREQKQKKNKEKVKGKVIWVYKLDEGKTKH